MFLLRLTWWRQLHLFLALMVDTMPAKCAVNRIKHGFPYDFCQAPRFWLLQGVPRTSFSWGIISVVFLFLCSNGSVLSFMGCYRILCGYMWVPQCSFSEVPVLHVLWRLATIFLCLFLSAKLFDSHCSSTSQSRCLSNVKAVWQFSLSVLSPCIFCGAILPDFSCPNDFCNWTHFLSFFPQRIKIFKCVGLYICGWSYF